MALIASLPGALSAGQAEKKKLVAQAQAGDLKALTSLTHMHEKRILHQAYLMIGDWSMARNVALRIFVLTFSELSQSQGECDFSALLDRISLQQFKKYIRIYRLRKLFSWFLWDSERQPLRKPEISQIKQIGPSGVPQTVLNKFSLDIEEEILLSNQKRSFKWTPASIALLGFVIGIIALGAFQFISTSQIKSRELLINEIERLSPLNLQQELELLEVLDVWTLDDDASLELSSQGLLEELSHAVGAQWVNPDTIPAEIL